MTDDFDVDAVAARHQRYPWLGYMEGRCVECRQEWGENGCDAAQALDVIRRQRALIDFLAPRDDPDFLERKLREAQK